MQRTSYNPDIEAVIITGIERSCLAAVKSILDDYKIEYSLCPDVYIATAQLAAKRFADKMILVIGSLEELSTENMRFFEFCQRIENLRCCCVAQNEPAPEITAAIANGALVINDPETLKNLISELLQNYKKTPKPVGASKNKPMEGANLTAEEMDALLGV